MKRYDVDTDTWGHYKSMVEVDDGDWVSFDDLPAWIPVGERLPETLQDVLVLRSDNCSPIWTAWLDEGKWIAYGHDLALYDVTHWMPLPEVP